MRIMAAVLALALCGFAHADTRHTLDGKSFTVNLKDKETGATATDTITFQGGQIWSEWLKKEGFDGAPYESGDDEFEAKFRKGEDKVKYEGEWENNGAMTGEVKWSRDREGGHRHWEFTAAAGDAPVAHTETATHAAPKASLYERLGGEPAIQAVVSTFIDGLVADPTNNSNPVIKARFAKADAVALKRDLSDFVGMATGGPQQYKGRSMIEIHKDMAIREKDWAAMAAVFVRTLDQYKVPKAEQDELLAVVGTTKKDVVTKP
jgi:hemoglobin